ncbi:hypothetical protein C8J57DRAFT_1530240 [Mycena rebaudengoi]|nr:hypothetical protein C8J57DRAFT_1530240 [Mycena rebaudengoi]
MQSQATTHASRNPSKQVQETCGRKKGPLTDSQKATRAVAALARKLAKEALEDDLNKFYALRNKSILDMAAAHDRDPEYIKQLIMSESQYKMTCPMTIRNTLMHNFSVEVKTAGNPLSLVELHALADVVLPETCSAEEEERLWAQLSAHRELHRVGLHTSNAAAAADTRSLSSFMQEEDWHVGFFSLTHGHVDDATMPTFGDAGDGIKFCTEALKMQPLHIVRQFEQWFCTRDLEPMANPNSEMPTAYEDSEFYIEDRTTRRTFHQRKRAGFWIGDTYIAALGDSLEIPPPPRGANTGGNPGPGAGTPAPTIAVALSTCPVAIRFPLTMAAAGTGNPPSIARTSYDNTPYTRACDFGTSPTGAEVTRRHDSHTGSPLTTHPTSAMTTAAWWTTTAPAPSSLIGHRYSSSDWPRIVASPDLQKAPRGSDAHPQAPSTVRSNDPEYVGSDEGVTSDFDYVEREESRLADLRARPPNPNETTSAVQPRNSQLGLFLYIQIATLAQVLNLVGWLQRALGTFAAKAKLTCCDINKRLNRTGRRPYASNHYVTGSAASSASVTLQPAVVPTRAPAPLGIERTVGCAYLGTAPPNPTDDGPQDPPGEFATWTRLPNSVASLYAVLHYYTFLATSGWVLGLRNMMRRMPIALNDMPLNDDVLAYHTILAMSPINRRNIPHQFRRFFDTVIMMFSIPGLFDAIIVAGGYPAAVLALAHYLFLTDNIVMGQVAAWFMQHGIVLGSTDVHILESFVRARRNVKADIPDLENSTWNEAPRSIEEAISMFPITPWDVLMHAPLAVPNSTVHPPRSGGARHRGLLACPYDWRGEQRCTPRSRHGVGLSATVTQRRPPGRH